jgi:hypothetical protein
MLSMSVGGAAELRYIAARLRKTAAVGLRKELGKAQRQAFRPLEKEIKGEAGVSLPSGYAPPMARTVKVSVSTRLGEMAVTARIFARGRKELRDVASVNRGLLRHPLFGNRRYWFRQGVRPGFVDRPVRRLEDRIVRESRDALERVANEIVR